ncbi:L-dopachrome tautomerase-related protein [Paenibacillus lautus]|uniref:L-dopachrome tautomerase-related protein n=1 Tax=Paenibacillus lautus TaxID=1401 RepID=UPI0026E936B5|nr:L-dopachrome tautomerase-related protein [Paenibacillus lautus]MCI1774017.1 major royal jelly family protein [Paenibacillus lautus]
MYIPYHPMGMQQQTALPHAREAQAHHPTSPYQMLFHWNRLDWNFPNAAMKQRFELHQYWKHCMPAGVKVDRQGRFYVSVPRWAEGVPATLNTIVMVNGKPVLDAFPSWEWNTPGDVRVLQSVLGYEIDEHNRMWILDQGKIAYNTSPEGSQKLVIWDLNANRLIDSMVIPDDIAPPRTSFLNDIVVDNRNGYAYITDSGSGWPDHEVYGGIIVYNMRTKRFRRVLDSHYSTQDVPRFRFEIDTEPVYRNKPVRIGADGIALSADRETLFYCQVTGRNLYAIDTGLLRNFDTPDHIIRNSVQALGCKGTTTDGMHADNQGHVFYTMLEGKGIGYYSPCTRSFHKLLSDDRMLWVDGVAFDQRGSIIFNNNRLHRMFEEPQNIDWDDPYNLIIWRAYIGRDVKSYLYG